MAGSPTAAPASQRLAAPDRHPSDRPVPLALFQSDVRRPASAMRGDAGTPAADPTI
jgi:hypothetical protein